MAYLSRYFAGNRKQDAPTSGAPAALSAESPAGPGPAPTTPDGSVTALRAFFDANRGAGEQMLSGIADRITKRLGDAGDQARESVRQETTTTPGRFASDLPPGQGFGGLGYRPPSTTTHNVVDRGGVDAAQGAYDSAAGDARALIGGDISGLSALVPQNSNQAGRVLDAWLMRGALGRGDVARRLQGSLDSSQNAIRGALSAPSASVPAPVTSEDSDARRRRELRAVGDTYTGRGRR